jgi:glycosyltransferase involved in cell wall biosynthesis
VNSNKHNTIENIVKRGKMKKILVIVPAYNEEKNIEKTVRDLKLNTPLCDILVIDDGSVDRTRELAEQAGATVVSLPVNLGIGGAVQTGFIYALNNGYSIALQVDGDGQHRADEIQKLVEPIFNSEADVTIGSRFLSQTSYKAPISRRLGIIILSWTINTVVRKRFTDPTSGFRAYNRKALNILCKHYSIDYPEPDAIVTLIKNGLELTEITVEMEHRQHGKSSITPLKSGYYMLKVSLAIVLNSLMDRIWREQLGTDSNHRITR